VFLDVPVNPDRETAREWAVDELSKREYQTGTGTNWLQSFMEWIQNLIASIGDGFGGTWNGWGLVGAIAIGLGLASLLLWLVIGPLRRSRGRKVVDDDLGDPDVTAAELAAAAATAARAGDWNAAVIGAYRSLIRSLAERDAIDARPGMTALEAAIAASVAMPTIATDVGEDADVFDAVRYGHLEATEAHYRHVVATRDAAAKGRIEVFA
jgi:hypothetical protein